MSTNLGSKSLKGGSSEVCLVCKALEHTAVVEGGSWRKIFLTVILVLFSFTQYSV